MNESMDRVLADWLREGPESGPREGLERALAATRRVGQKPGWAFLERWLPMQLTIARTPSLRPILAIVMLALLIVALVATVLFIGSQRRPLPPPFGPARNGAVVYDQERRPVSSPTNCPAKRGRSSSGPETDGWPSFSNQGDRIAFVRVGEGDFQVMSCCPTDRAWRRSGSSRASSTATAGRRAGTRSSSTSRNRTSRASGMPSSSRRLGLPRARSRPPSGLRRLAARRQAHRLPWPARRRQCRSLHRRCRRHEHPPAADRIGRSRRLRGSRLVARREAPELHERRRSPWHETALADRHRRHRRERDDD